MIIIQVTKVGKLFQVEIIKDSQSKFTTMKTWQAVVQLTLDIAKRAKQQVRLIPFKINPCKRKNPGTSWDEDNDDCNETLRDPFISQDAKTKRKNPKVMYTAAQVKKMLKVLGFKASETEKTKGASKTWFTNGNIETAKKALSQVLIPHLATVNWANDEWEGRGFQVSDVSSYNSKPALLLAIYNKSRAGLEYSMGVDN